MTNVGIWQGRFQFVHNGHVYIFEKELSKFNEKYVAIVNPNPLCPAATGGDFDRFTANLNPFSYFSRMLLWKKVADDKKMNVNIVPCWHGRYVIALENEFLPPRPSRSWIIPVAQSDGEENKANDLRKKGENIHPAHAFLDEADSFAAISASKIRVGRENGKNWKQYVPECIAQLTEDLLEHNAKNNFIVVPFIGNTLDLHSLQSALALLKQTADQDCFVVFAISVMVQSGKREWIDSSRENTPWWFKPSDNTYSGHNINFYVKAKMLNELMSKLNITNYLVTPMFVMDQSFSSLSDYNNAFLPPMEKSTWIINRMERAKGDCGYYKFGFNDYLTNVDATTQAIDEGVIDDEISTFFSDDRYRSFSNNQQRKVVIDFATRIALEARVAQIESNLSKLLGGSNPPERATAYLKLIQEIHNRLCNGWDFEWELQQDQASITNIANWLNNIA
ncbi:MAG: hypothetical protein J6Q55_00875 [Clostridia bacterium]|nr:hypothetical protein [Clostridia bacterium]